LAVGDYDGEITITGTPNVIPQTIMVHLHVRTAGPLITSIEDAGAANPGFANGSFIAIKGFGLSSTTRIWKDSDFQGNKLPTSLDGVSVRVQGQNAFVYFISENQVNVITPDNALNNTRFGITLFRGSQASNQFVANT